MSRFSGKFDLYDDLFMTHDCDLDYLKKCQIYVGYSLEKDKDGKVQIVPGKRIHIEQMKDIVPYFPYLVLLSYACEDGRAFYLSERSWPDMEKDNLNQWGVEYRMYDYYKSALEEEMKKYEEIKDEDY